MRIRSFITHLLVGLALFLLFLVGTFIYLRVTIFDLLSKLSKSTPNSTVNFTRRLLCRSYGWLVSALKLFGLLRVEFVGDFSSPGIYLSNHHTLLDALVILSRFECGVCVAKRELLRVPIMGGLIRYADYPVVGAGIEVVNQARIIVESGGSIIIFPEGTRSKDGQLGKFRRGVGYLINQTITPIYGVILRVSSPFLNHQAGFLSYPNGGVDLRIKRLEDELGWVRSSESLGSEREKAQLTTDKLHSFFNTKIGNSSQRFV